MLLKDLIFNDNIAIVEDHSKRGLFGQKITRISGIERKKEGRKTLYRKFYKTQCSCCNDGEPEIDYEPWGSWKKLGIKT